MRVQRFSGAGGAAAAREGDAPAVRKAGAYGFAMSSQYNCMRAAEVLRTGQPASRAAGRRSISHAAER